MTDASYDSLRLIAEIRARTGRQDQGAGIGAQARGLAAFARPGAWRTARDMHQAAERAAQADHDPRPDQG